MLREPAATSPTARRQKGVHSMIGEMMTLLEAEQVGDDNKKAYYIKSFRRERR